MTAEDDQFLLVIDGEMIGAVPRTTTREVHRFKATAGRATPCAGHRRQETASDDRDIRDNRDRRLTGAGVGGPG